MKDEVIYKTHSLDVVNEQLEELKQPRRVGWWTGESGAQQNGMPLDDIHKLDGRYWASVIKLITQGFSVPDTTDMRRVFNNDDYLAAINERGVQREGQGVRPHRASDIGAIMGLSPWRSKREAWLHYIKGEESEFKGNFYTRLGSALESFILSEGLRQLGGDDNAILLSKDTAPMPTFKCGTAAYLQGTPDAIGTLGGELCVIEIKNTSMPPWAELPNMYYAQLQAYMYLTNIPRAALFAMHEGRTIEYYDVDFDEAAFIKIAEALVEMNTRTTAPPPTSEEDMRAIYRTMVEARPSRDVVRLIDNQAFKLAEDYSGVSMQFKEASAEVYSIRKSKDELLRQLNARIEATLGAESNAKHDFVISAQGGEREVLLCRKVTHKRGYTVEAKSYVSESAEFVSTTNANFTNQN